MADRTFKENELRVMMDEAQAFEPGAEAGRCGVPSHRDAAPWETIVEPETSALAPLQDG